MDNKEVKHMSRSLSEVEYRALATITYEFT